MAKAAAEVTEEVVETPEAPVKSTYDDWEDGWKAERDKMIADLAEPFSAALIKSRKGANGVDLDYVAGHTVILRLNRATNNNWSCDFAFEPKFQTMQVRKKKNGIPSVEETLVAVIGVWLEIPGLGRRAGLGVAKVDGNSEDLFKGALTDAIKNAAKLFGVALHLYGSDDEGENLANF